MTKKEKREYDRIRAIKYRKENREKHLKSRRDWYCKHKDNVNQKKRKWRKENRKSETKNKRFYRDIHPWSKTWESICSRLKYSKYYINIKSFLSFKELKYLWFRDKAFKMQKPRIHRINKKDNYTLKNCVYVEASWHSGFHNKERTKKRLSKPSNLKKCSNAYQKV